jgi:hypothetical protein
MAKKSGIVIDLTKITKRQMLEWRKGRRDIDEPDDMEQYDFENLYQLVLVSWPWGEINFENYLDLSYPDSTLVDNTITDAITALTEKK